MILAKPGDQQRKAKLGDFFRIKHGYAFKGAFFSNSGHYVLLTPGNFHDKGGFKLKGSREKYYTGEVPPGYILRKSDLLVAMTEQAEGLLGSSALIPESGLYLHNQRLGLVTNLDESVLEKKFLYYLFNSPDVRAQIRATANGAKVRHTSPARIYEVNFTLLPFSTQRRISTILSAYDNLIENNTRRIAILEEMARRLYDEWFVQFRFPGHAEKERNWKSVRLGDLVQVDKGVSYKGAFLDEAGKSMVNLKNFDRAGGFRRDGLKFYTGDHKSRHMVKSGAIVLANTDLTQAGNVIGSPAIIPRRLPTAEAIISHHVYALRLGEEVRNQPFFVYQLLASTSFKGFAKGHASGTTVLGLSRESVLMYEFELPPEALRQEYESSVEPVHTLIEVLSEKNTNLRAQRDLLLPKLISGEVDVSEVTEPPREAAE